MRLRPLLLSALLASGSALAGCSADDVVDDAAASSNEALTERDWGRAISYLGSLDYLPWGYTDDGCYARAIYYTMNLAAEGISSNHVYIIAKDGAHGLGSTGRWRYHVAPLVSRDGANELRVLDPVYSSQPLLLRDWYDRQSNWENTPNAPILKVAPGTTFGDLSGNVVPDPHAASTASFREPPSFASMPAFSIGNLNAACGIMHRYIDLETTTNADQKARKHHGLSRDSKRIFTALTDLGKLSGGGGLDASCTAYAPELAGCPADTRTNNPGSTECCLASAFWCQSTSERGVGSGSTCMAPGAVLGDGRVCSLGGNFAHPAGSTAGGGGTSGGACPVDSASNNPGSQACCLASRYWCWSNSGGFCAAPGTRRAVSGVTWTCGAGGEWTR